jgi:light-regulated signal transduction histidine kinase (bacteriophytochrome)
MGQPRLYVHDNGGGFEMQLSRALLGVFQRWHKSSELPGSGSGSRSQRVKHRPCGRVWAEALSGQIATTYFRTGTGDVG